MNVTYKILATDYDSRMNAVVLEHVGSRRKPYCVTEHLCLDNKYTPQCGGDVECEHTPSGRCHIGLAYDFLTLEEAQAYYNGLVAR